MDSGRLCQVLWRLLNTAVVVPIISYHFIFICSLKALKICSVFVTKIVDFIIFSCTKVIINHVHTCKYLHSNCKSYKLIPGYSNHEFKVIYLIILIRVLDCNLTHI